MSGNHKPLSAAEIEELRELEATATPGPWEPDDMAGPKTPYLCHKSAEGRPIIGRFDYNAPADMALIAAMRNALPRLLSMLQPPTDAIQPNRCPRCGGVEPHGMDCPCSVTGPTDAAVREAVRHAEYVLAANPFGPHVVMINEPMLRTLLSHLRAVQSPGLTGEQAEALRRIDILAIYIDNPSAWGAFDQSLSDQIAETVELAHAAFPGVFGKEG